MRQLTLKSLRGWGSGSGQSSRTNSVLKKEDRQAVAARGQVAQAALRVIFQREYRELLASMASLKKEVTGKLSNMFGRDWSRRKLYDFYWLRDKLGVKGIEKDLPELYESFEDQFEAITDWRIDVSKYQDVMHREPDVEKQSREVLCQWMVLRELLSAVEAAANNLDEMDEVLDR